jgi:hypothetical protein
MYLSSRYRDGLVQPAEHDGKVVTAVVRRFPPKTEYVVYRWKDGDRIDMLAGSLGFMRLHWWEILDANPEYPSPTMIPPGAIIRIPRT